jgi:hypothetical protein
MTNDVAEMLAYSREELELVCDELGAKSREQSICHLFYGPENIKSDSKEEKAYLSILVPALRQAGFEVDVIGGSIGVEAWGRARLSNSWSDKIVPLMCAIGDRAGCEYGGWTWEPKGRPNYVARLTPMILAIAFGLSFMFAIDVAFDWYMGDLGDKVTSNIAGRTWRMAIFIAIISVPTAILHDWYERRKYR